MKIKSQFIFSLIVFVIILLIITLSIFVLDVQITRIGNNGRAILNIQYCASELAVISNHYLIYQESMQLELWKTQFFYLANNLTELYSLNPEQQAIKVNIENDVSNLNATFANIVFLLEESAMGREIRVLPEFQALWTQISDGNHALLFNSAQMSQALSDQANSLLRVHTVLIIIMLGLFTMYFLLTYLLLQRHTLRSITKLQKGAEIIGSGDLDYSVKIKTKDEIGALSNSFNQMATNLKQVISSKAELEEEIAKRKKAEAKLEQYSKNLEALVEERTKQLKESERLAAIGATPGMVGHDIRNPLQAMISDVFLAKSDLESMPEGEEKEGIKESLIGIEKNIAYINKIVADLQDYARPLKPELVEVTDFCSIIGEIVHSANIPSSIDILLTCNREISKARIELTFLKRILLNLITNAVQAMPDGGKLEIAAFEKNRKLMINVQDTGVGIPEDVKPKIFQPMLSTKAKGQGLGLAVVKRLVEAQDGMISFESQIGEGTRFIIELPLLK